MRLFIALDFDEFKSYFGQLQNQFLSFGSYSLPRSFHLTLKFLGDVDDARVGSIIKMLSGIRFLPIMASLSIFGVFPDRNSVKVMWLGVEPYSEIVALQKNIDLSLDGLFDLDKRFHPHITLARIKVIRDKDAFARTLDKKVDPLLKEINVFHLVKSTLTPKGSLYETICSFHATKDF
jgi:2'-5' RNA ligase